MSAVSHGVDAGSRSPLAAKRHVLHPIATRLFHWVNAGATLIMIGSGMAIYNAHPILPFSFPGWLTIGGWLGGATMWHFAAMWFLAGNLSLWLVHGFLTGRFRRKLWPISPRAVLADALAALKGQLGHADLSVYNAVQRLLYAGVLLLLVLAVTSGLAIWKPVQLRVITTVLGGFQGARLVHFLAMSGIAGFVVIHVIMALTVPKSLVAMIRGR
jgi:thiosulfate reductase cytochrome b subunit